MAIALPSIETGTSSFGQMCDRIADELVRPDLRASHIPLAVNDAIKEAATNRFWFNEVRGLTFNTVSGRDFYDNADYYQLAFLSKIDALWLVINGQRWNMDPVNALDIEDWMQGQTTLTGEPSHYARYANGIRFWMVPRESWAVYIDGVMSFAPLSGDSDTNPYVSEGERYIRALAKANLLEGVIRDFDQADRQWQLAEREKANLLKETNNQTATNYRRPFL